MIGVKRTYKDSLFCRLFGDERRKGSALELYNALAGTDHVDPGELELNTIGDMIFGSSGGCVGEIRPKDQVAVQELKL